MVILVNDTTARFVDNNVGSIQEILPPGVWEICMSMQGIWLEKQEVPVVPDFLFGDVEEYSDFIVGQFKRHGKRLGLWLNGLKGTGKTVQLRSITRKAVDSGLPVIRINQGISGAALVDILGNLKQPFAVTIDEFDKVYGTSLGDENNTSDEISGEKQGSLLSFLDGGLNQPCLTIITTNDAQKVSSFIRGRVGRIRYRRDYGYMTDEDVRSVCNHLIPEIDPITVSKIQLGNQWSLDSLTTVLEEVKDFPESSITKVLSVLNLDIHQKSFQWSVFYNGVSVGQLQYGWGFSTKEDTFDQVIATLTKPGNSFLYLPREVPGLTTRQPDNNSKKARAGNDYEFDEGPVEGVQQVKAGDITRPVFISYDLLKDGTLTIDNDGKTIIFTFGENTLVLSPSDVPEIGNRKYWDMM